METVMDSELREREASDPRPVVFGVYSEEEKRHLLDKSRELKYTNTRM